MDPVSLVVAALVAGAAKGVGSSAESAVSAAYPKLKGVLGRLFQARQSAQVALEQHEAAPEVWKAPLEAELRAAGVGEHEDVVDAARQLLKLADPQGSAAGKYQVTIAGSQGVQVGDYNNQNNTYGTPPTV